MGMGLFSRALNRQMIEWFYLVSLRTRAVSDASALSGGPTLDCAVALQRDLHEPLSENADVPIGGMA